MTFRNEFPQALDVQVSDRVNLTSSFFNINSGYMVREIRHSVDAEAGWVHDVTFTLEHAIDFKVLVLDDAVKGVLDGDRTLGF